MPKVEWNPLSKSNPVRSRAYREFVRTCPCVCMEPNPIDEGCSGDVQFHHEKLGVPGGSKCSDLQGLPLCEYHHYVRTNYNGKWRAFYESRLVEPERKMLELINYFLANGGKL